MNLDKVKKVKNSKPIRKLDFVVIGCVVILSFVALFLLYNKKGNVVQVWVEGKMLYNLDIHSDTHIDIDVELGHMSIEIKDGKLSISHVDCPDQICKKMGNINKVNQSIVCAPNRVFLRVVGESDFDF